MTLDLRLTFDDGPSEWTYPLLDLLNAHHVKATFFVVGQHILGHENLLRRMIASGHTVGNHTLTHRKLTEADAWEIRAELEATCYLIERATNVYPDVYRAPYLTTDERVGTIAGDLDLDHVGADVNPDDWRLASAAEIVKRISDAAEAISDTLLPSPVVCLHDGIPPGGGNGTASRAATVEAVRILLERG